jgi:hypothetical protein
MAFSLVLHEQEQFLFDGRRYNICFTPPLLVFLLSVWPDEGFGVEKIYTGPFFQLTNLFSKRRLLKKGNFMLTSGYFFAAFIVHT